MGWDIAWKALAPGVRIAYQWHPKTVVRAGYGRCFDLGVFGSIFGHTVTPTMSLTIAYVGNKGTHTLSELDGNNTNPNEEAVFLPAAYSITGRALHYVPSSAVLPTAVNGINPDGGTNTSSFLQRYYALSLPACQSAAQSRSLPFTLTRAPRFMAPDVLKVFVACWFLCMPHRVIALVR